MAFMRRVFTSLALAATLCTGIYAQDTPSYRFGEIPVEYHAAWKDRSPENNRKMHEKHKKKMAVATEKMNGFFSGLDDEIFTLLADAPLTIRIDSFERGVPSTLDQMMTDHLDDLCEKFPDRCEEAKESSKGWVEQFHCNNGACFFDNFWVDGYWLGGESYVLIDERMVNSRAFNHLLSHEVDHAVISLAMRVLPRDVFLGHVREMDRLLSVRSSSRGIRDFMDLPSYMVRRDVVEFSAANYACNRYYEPDGYCDPRIMRKCTPCDNLREDVKTYVRNVLDVARDETTP